MTQPEERCCWTAVETAAYDLTSLRQAIGVVPQKAVLFKGTIRQNPALGQRQRHDSDLWKR